MGGVHQDIDRVPAEIVREPVRPAEPADPDIERKGPGRPRRAGERQGTLEAVVFGDRPGQLARLGRSAEQEDFQS